LATSNNFDFFYERAVRRLAVFGEFDGFLSIRLASKTLPSIRKPLFFRQNQIEVAFEFSSMKQHNISIDILKFLAALFITNSHMDMLYISPYKQLATGGQLGDALFFFCSGFTLFLGSIVAFDNWYKRRINRIYPTIFAVAIVSAVFFSANNDIVDIILNGGGWFVSCIMIYYFFLYFVHKYAIGKLPQVFLVLFVLFVAVYFLLSANGWYLVEAGKSFEKNKWITQSYFKWGYFFLFMLLGSMLSVTKAGFNYRFVPDFAALMISIVLWYIILIVGKTNDLVASLQIVGLVPLLGSTFYFYKVCNSDFATRVYNNKYAGAVIKGVGGLCLEIYLIQGFLYTTSMNWLFPLNILIEFALIVVSAYLLRCFARVLSQTFKDQDYDWKAVVRL
jgi:peptidoglycan/LPS O-acetylase OafA/YrhL